jgi:GMP synthase-like glutamine amidotransferase
MTRALILQHLDADGPGYLATWLARRGIAFDLRNTQAGDPFPATLGDHAALAVLGGEMSANDPLPSLRRAEALIREAVASGKPTLGHCLGGQLMARALGGSVGPSPAPEVGWHRIESSVVDPAHDWLGSPITKDTRPNATDDTSHTVYQWHYEAISPPPAAHVLAGNAACPVQAFSLGPHLAIQFHVEVDEAKLTRWIDAHDPRLLAAQAQHPSVHSAERMRADTQRHLAAQQALADRIYTRWWAGVAG